MADEEHGHSRAVSWVAVVIILAGFALGGVALILGLWWLFWTALGVVVAGGIFAVAIDISADVELDPLHAGEPHVSPIRHQIATGESAPAKSAPVEAESEKTRAAGESPARAEADTA